MMRYALASAIVIVGVGLLLMVWLSRDSETLTPPGALTATSTLKGSAQTDFAEIGTVTVGNPGQPPTTAVFVYEEPGAPALTTEFSYDEFSSCISSGRSLPCLAMSATPDAAFGGKRVLLEGERKDGRVVVRKLQVMEDTEPIYSPEAGHTFISWHQATQEMQACNVTFAMQTHALEVTLRLKDGREVTTIEPGIDEMFTVLNQVRDTCGAIPVATE